MQKEIVKSINTKKGQLYLVLTMEEIITLIENGKRYLEEYATKSHDLTIHKITLSKIENLLIDDSIEFNMEDISCMINFNSNRIIETTDRLFLKPMMMKLFSLFKSS